MGKAAVPLSLFGLLLTVVTALPVRENWDIYSYHINSTVSSRYAVTIITSRVANRMEESKEIEFHVRIPKNAFISKFKMVIEGEEYDGVVKEKEKAQQQYSQAVSQGQSAGIVSSVGRTLEEFKTSVTVAAHKKVTFELTYEELLKRRLGKYELQIHARPMQPVKDFKVDVYMNENAGINSLLVKGGLSTKALANAITTNQTEKEAWVHFYPTVQQQQSCDSCDNKGMNGDLVVVYDVNRDSSLGDIKRSRQYFVHHFAPSNLPRIPKNVIFIIDQSGSMHGRKMQQTRIALIHILNDLAEDDFFGVITFDSSIFHWKGELVQATKENLESAKTFARNIKDNGATDINAAVLSGAAMLNAHPREGSASILILLTDGDPTTGETNREVIQSNVRKAITDKFPLYCLGFGFDVNFKFLETMSLQNNGVARRIYEDSDADLQLKGFYEEVATPVLTDVTMVYTGGTNLTKTNFSQYYKGSEIVVAGQISDNDVDTFTPQVLAISKSGRLVFADTNATMETSDATVSDSQMQRVWAYLTVKQLLDKELQLSGSEKADAKNEALTLSLRYGFVTPLTSMVVTKPQGESTDVLDKPKEGSSGFTKHLVQGLSPNGFVAGPPGFAVPGVAYASQFPAGPPGFAVPGVAYGSQFPAGPAGIAVPGVAYGSQFPAGPAGIAVPGVAYGSQFPAGPAGIAVPGVAYGSQFPAGPAGIAVPGVAYGSQFPAGPPGIAVPGVAYGSQFPAGPAGIAVPGVAYGSQFPAGPAGIAVPGVAYGSQFPAGPLGIAVPGVAYGSQFPAGPAGIAVPGVAYGSQFPAGPLGIAVPGVAYGSQFPAGPAGIAVPGVAYGSQFPAGPPGFAVPGVAYASQLTVPVMYRFMRNASDGSLPLCFDVPVGRLKLLHHPNLELSVNGELGPESPAGFSKIVFHLKEEQHIEVEGSTIVVRDKQSIGHHTGDEVLTVGSATVIRRGKEIEIAVGDTRIVLLIHLFGGKEFFWPVLRQRPSDSSATGILTLQPVVYEELQQQKLKIDNQEIQAIRVTAVDYSVPSPQPQDCWLTSAGDALQTPLDHFTVPEL